jgi:hypothetical protein
MTARPRLVSRSGAAVAVVWLRGAWPRTARLEAARLEAVRLEAVRLESVWLESVWPAGAVWLTGAGPCTARMPTVRPWNLQMAAAWRSGSSSGKAIACIALMATSVIKPSFELYCVRSLLRSIVFLFDRKSYYIVVSRGSDIFGDTSNRCLGYGAKNASL